MFRFRTALPRYLSLLLMFLVACGGGGSQSSSPSDVLNPSTPTAPQITAQPSAQTVAVGQTATFSVAVTGGMPLSYQWSKNGTSLSGATGPTYTTPATTSADNGAAFSVTVSNSAGSVTSSNATLTVTTGAPASSATDVVTSKNDALRTGQDLTETTLTPANVNSSSFGLLHNLIVDSKVDAQPLYLSQLSAGGSPHNVVFVATENDSVYAFDADSAAQLWKVSLLASGETPSDDQSCSFISPAMGITSTPVIDRTAGAHGTMFVVAMSKDSSGAYHQRLHALDVTTGAELLSGPKDITATYTSTTFVPGPYAERAALLLSQGTVYTSWTSHCDHGAYGGWIIAYSESSLAQTGVINVAPGASGSGPASQGPAIWMSGGGPAADAAGNVYVLTGNGKFETTLTNGFPSGGDYGNSFVKISSNAGTLTVSDYFAMYNEVSESQADTDLGSGGIMLLPDLTDASNTVQHLAVGAGKDGNLYVVNRDSMGKFNSSKNNIWAEFDGALNGGVWSTPAYFSRTIYYGPVGGPMLAFTLDGNLQLPQQATSQTSTQFGYPGTFPVISANGTSNAIVWAYENAGSGSAVLHAYTAGNLATELYNSTQASNGRDQFGSGNKFMVPTVADGKVFAASTNSVAVFGLLH